MKKTAICLLLVICFAQCKKNNNPLNITLYDKPLAVIQSYSLGKWKLQYTDGGIVYQKYIATHNSYMNLSQNRIQFGNDSIGVTLDTALVWKQTTSGTGNLYLLEYYNNIIGYTLPNYSLIIEIKNDTLVLRDYTSDPFFYHYTKF